MKREGKMSTLVLVEKTKELEKLRSELFEKKTKEIQMMLQQNDKILTNLEDLNKKIPLLLNNLNGIGKFNLTEINSESLSSSSLTKNNDIDLLKYQEKIIKNEAELDLAKKTLIMYMSHVEELQLQLEALTNNDSNEQIFLNQEILELKLENNKLKEENCYLLDLNKKLEENIMNSLNKNYEKIQELNEFNNNPSNMLKNNLKVINMEPTKKETKPNKILKNLNKNEDLKRLCKQTVDIVQILQKNMNSIWNFEGNPLKSLKESIKLYEKRIAQFQNVYIYKKKFYFFLGF